MNDLRVWLAAAAAIATLSGCASGKRSRPVAAPNAQRAHAGVTPLGSREVSFRGDHDTIMVTARDGAFRALRLHVSGSPLEMGRVKITFGNGQAFSPPLKHVFRQGAWTRRIDLPGKQRVIRKVEFWYRSVGKKSGRASVQVMGIR